MDRHDGQGPENTIESTKYPLIHEYNPAERHRPSDKKRKKVDIGEKWFTVHDVTEWGTPGGPRSLIEFISLGRFSTCPTLPHPASPPVIAKRITPFSPTLVQCPGELYCTWLVRSPTPVWVGPSVFPEFQACRSTIVMSSCLTLIAMTRDEFRRPAGFVTDDRESIQPILQAITMSV